MNKIKVMYEGWELDVEYIDGEDYQGRWCPEIEDIYNKEGKSIMDDFEDNDFDNIYELISDAFYDEANEFRIEREVRKYEDHKYRSI